MDDFNVDDFYDQDDGQVKFADGEQVTFRVKNISRGGSTANQALNIALEVIASDNEANIGKEYFTSMFFKNFQGFQNRDLKVFLDAFLAKPRAAGEKVGYDYIIDRVGKCKIKTWTSKKTGEIGYNLNNWEDMGTADECTEW